jgi:hypothetical protein
MVKKNKDKLPRARPIITYEKPESPKPLFNSPEITRSTTNIVTRSNQGTSSFVKQRQIFRH